MTQISADVLALKTCREAELKFDTGYLDHYNLDRMTSTDIQILPLLHGAYEGRITYRLDANMTNLQKDRIKRELHFAIYQRMDLSEARL